MFLIFVIILNFFFVPLSYGTEKINAQADSIKVKIIKELEEAPSTVFESFWKSRFRIYNFSDRSAEDTIFSTELYAKLNWYLLDSFSIHTEGLAIGRNGFTQSIYDRSDRHKGFHFIAGFFKWQVLPYFNFKFGNIKQDFLDAPLLVTDKTFPSLIETFELVNSKSLKVSLLLQQAIPSNATESIQREAQIIKTPLFLTTSIFVDQKNNFFNFKNKLTGFYFSKLSPAIADQGRIYGNTINFTRYDSRFKYRFLGVYNKSYLRVPLSGRWIGEIGADFIYNFLAPDTFNQGEKFYLSFYYDFYDLMEIRVLSEYFANQSDTSVSYYNSEMYGHNNRVGGGISLQSYFYKSGLRFQIDYKHTRPINSERSVSGVANSIVILIGTNYVSI